METISNMLTVRAARGLILASISPLEKKLVDLSVAGGSYLAEPIFAPFDLPSFTNSSMDGYAVVAKDVFQASANQPAILHVIGDIPAGSVPGVGIKPGEAMRIMTGAMIPDGADAVVPLELTEKISISAGECFPKFVKVVSPVEPGAYIRQIGEDVKKGFRVLEPHKHLRPQDIGMLAMLGIREVRVWRNPRVALISTGSELLPLSEKLVPGKVYDSNSYLLSMLIKKYGGETVDAGLAGDTADHVAESFERAFQARVDLIVSSAGVSVGAFDYVRSVVEKNGTLDFWRVNIRPGKPLAFGNYKGIPFIGLPGNPVSAFVGFEIFIRPVLLRMSGSLSFSDFVMKATLLEAVQSDGRESYLRARVWEEDQKFYVRPVENQSSGNLLSLVQANAFLIVPSEVKSLPIGAQVEVLISDVNYFESSKESFR